MTTGNPKMDLLREFATMAALATGQTYAPLLQPITHDGVAIRSSFISLTGDRLLTLGMDKTARFWDSFSGRQIALLRRADEKVIQVGLSPDGATAFTHALDGVVRLWETKDGTFRAETEARPGRIGFENFDAADPLASSYTSGVTQLSNDRLITSRVVMKRLDDSSVSLSYPGPVELWDAKTGRFIARIEMANLDQNSCKFFGDGQWIEAHDSIDRKNILHVFSAENGRPIAKLKHDEKCDSLRLIPKLSSKGRTAATMSVTNEHVAHLHFWDTSSWQLSSISGPINGGDWFDDGFQLIADDRFTMGQINGTTGIYRTGTATPFAELPGGPVLFQGFRVLLDSGQIFDTQTWRRLQPPKGRKYHPDITRFAPDGRFLGVQTGHISNETARFECIDTITEKSLPNPQWYGHKYLPKLGWVSVWQGRTRRLPPPDHLAIPPDLLELWVQVAVRGRLDDEGSFVKWDEATWEKKRQELAAKPAPYPDFPFPGHVARDRLHWLRGEYESASDGDKPRLAKQLLDRAEAAGDKAEAVRWRTILTPKPPLTKPAAPK